MPMLLSECYTSEVRRQFPEEATEYGGPLTREKITTDVTRVRRRKVSRESRRRNAPLSQARHSPRQIDTAGR